MKKITLLAAFFVAFAFEGNAQTGIIAIDSAGVGGFETADTFEENGWTVLNHTYGSRKWQVGTGQPGYFGQRGAFIGSNPTTVGTSAGGRTVHFYREITIPAEATNVQLTFSYKQEVAFFDPVTGDPNDYLYISLLSAAPVNGTTASPNFSGKIPAETVLPDFTEMTLPLPTGGFGTTQYLTFSFRSNNLNDPATVGWGAIDNIHVTYDMPLGTENFNLRKISVYPNPVKDVLNLTAAENIDTVSIFNLFGQNLLNKEINATEGIIDMSAFATGTYIVNVQSENNVKTIKVVK